MCYTPHGSDACREEGLHLIWGERFRLLVLSTEMGILHLLENVFSH